MEVQARVPRLILILLIASAFSGLGWAALIPLWHMPDEQAHFAQAQDIAATGGRPNPGFSTSQDIVTSEQFLGTFRDNRGNNRFTYHPEYRIPYTNGLEGFHEMNIVNFPIAMREMFIIKEATGYPPLYYWFIAFLNRGFWGHDLIFRVFVSRLATVMLSTTGVYVSYLLAREIFRERIYAIATAALVAFHPMWKFVGSAVTSDALMNVLYPLTILYLIRFIHRPQRSSFWKFTIVFLATLLTKTQSTLLLLLALPVAYSVVRNHSSFPRLERSLVVIGVVGALFGMVLTILNHTRLGEVYPQIFGRVFIPEIDDRRILQAHPTIGEFVVEQGRELYKQTVPWYWGVYRWLSLTLPLWAYRIIKVIIGLSVLGWIKAGVTRFRSLPSIANTTTLKLILASSVIYSQGLLWWNFLFWKSHGFPLGIQGRYFFPNLPEHLMLLLIGLFLLVPVKWRGVVLFSSVFSMIVFHWYSLFFVSASYYDTSSLSTFLIQASQYKPWFFKSPFLSGVLCSGLLSSLAFLIFFGYYMRRSRHGP